MQFLTTNAISGTVTFFKTDTNRLYATRIPTLLNLYDIFIFTLLNFPGGTLFNRVNPLRAGLVDTLAKLDWYRWCGHSALMGRRKNIWQDCEYVLGWFSSSKEADLLKKYRFMAKERQDKAVATIEAVCNGSGISIEALRNGSRRREVSQVRIELAMRLTVEYGLSFAEAARQLGITTSAVARIIDQSMAVI